MSSAEDQEIAEKVRSGEFFREGRQMYELAIHDPMAERYLYVVITTLSILTLLITFMAVRALYPLQTSVPFIVSTTNIAEDLPRIKSLMVEKGEDPGEALLRFMVQNYVTLHEEYDIADFDRNISGVKSQSSPEVFAEFQKSIDPRSPTSPITLYQRHSRRVITILSSRRLDDQEFGMETVFEARVESRTEIKKSRWQANIAFNYSGIELDEETEKVKPVTFVVTSYNVRRLQDTQ